MLGWISTVAQFFNVWNVARKHKSWTSLNFTFKLDTLASILFPRRASKIYVRVHALKNFSAVEIHPEKEREVREFEIDFKKYFIENDTF